MSFIFLGTHFDRRLHLVPLPVKEISVERVYRIVRLHHHDVLDLIVITRIDTRNSENIGKLR